MEKKIKKAHDKLAELALFSDDFEAFSRFFYDNLKEGKEKEAMEILLLVVYGFLKSEGELFNTLLLGVDKAKGDGLKAWVKDSLQKIMTTKGSV